MLAQTHGKHWHLTTPTRRAAAKPVFAGLVFYDGRCTICRRGARFWGQTLKRRGFVLTPLQRRWVGEKLKLERAELMVQVWLLRPDGELLGGADAVLAIAERVWWARPLVWASRVRGAMPVLRRMYGVIARNRYCAGGKCEIDGGRGGRRSGHRLTGFWEI